MNTSMLTKPVKKRKGRNISSEASLKVDLMISCPESDGCARASINGWEWRNWARNATPSERARVRGYRVRSILSASNKKLWNNSQDKMVSSARTNRVKLRRLLRAYTGAELLKITQMKVNWTSIFHEFLFLWGFDHTHLWLSWCVGEEKAFTFSEEQDPWLGSGRPWVDRSRRFCYRICWWPDSQAGNYTLFNQPFLNWCANFEQCIRDWFVPYRFRTYVRLNMRRVGLEAATFFGWMMIMW